MSAKRELRELRVLVTGGSSGIGLSVAEQLASCGAHVVLLARGREGLADAATRVPGCRGIVGADVGIYEELERGIEEAVGLLGSLDVVVAAAGVGAYGPFLEMDPQEYRETVVTTLVGFMNIAHIGVPLLEANGGRLVFVGSVAGRVPVPWLAAYTAAKHGGRGFVRSLDAELRAQNRAVSVSLIAPGPVDTPFWERAPTPDGRLPPKLLGAYSAEDVASEVVRSISSPARLERTVGGLMLLAILVDALVPNLVQVSMGLIARLGWRARDEHAVSDGGGLVEPRREAGIDGDLHPRPSGLQKLRNLGALHR